MDLGVSLFCRRRLIFLKLRPCSIHVIVTLHTHAHDDFMCSFHVDTLVFVVVVTKTIRYLKGQSRKIHGIQQGNGCDKEQPIDGRRSRCFGNDFQ